MNPNRSDVVPPDTVATFLEDRSPSSIAQLLSSAVKSPHEALTLSLPKSIFSMSIIIFSNA